MPNFPCEADLNLYTAKRLPGWAQSMRAEKAQKTPASWQRADLIDLAVNAHAGVRVTSGECAAQNTLALVNRHMLAKAPALAIADRFEQIARDTEALVRSNPARKGLGDLRRASFARKWAKKLRGTP